MTPDAGCRQGTPAPGEPERREPGTPRLCSVEPDRYPSWEAIYLDNVERLYRIRYSKVGNRPDA